jgi:hypothetical protein
MDIRKEKPKRDTLEYYGDDYSVPVLIQKYGKVTHVVRWDFVHSGWVDYLFEEGPFATEYDYGDDWYYWQNVPIFT